MDHSDEKYQCEEMSACPYTGTTTINKIPWAGQVVGWVWSPQEDLQGDGGMMEVSFDVVRDRYFTTNTAGGERRGWRAGVWRFENIQRKDYPWEDMVFLAREYSEEPGLLEWRVEVREGERISRVVVRVESRVSERASVRWEVSGGGNSLTVSPGTELDTNQLAGATQISLQATLLADPHSPDTELFTSSRTEEKQPDTKLKLLVYFGRSGTLQDQHEDKETEKTKKCYDEREVGDAQEESDTNSKESPNSQLNAVRKPGLLDKIKRLFRNK